MGGKQSTTDGKKDSNGDRGGGICCSPTLSCFNNIKCCNKSVGPSETDKKADAGIKNETDKKADAGIKNETDKKADAGIKNETDEKAAAVNMTYEPPTYDDAVKSGAHAESQSAGSGGEKKK